MQFGHGAWVSSALVQVVITLGAGNLVGVMEVARGGGRGGNGGGAGWWKKEMGWAAGAASAAAGWVVEVEVG